MVSNLRERLKNFSLEQREALLAKIRQQSLSQNQKGSYQKLSILPASRKEPLPLSYAQQRLWFLEEMGSGVAYNMPTALLVSGKLNVKVFKQTLNEIVRRHESLRTTFQMAEHGAAPGGVQAGTPCQVIQAAVHLGVEVVDLSALASDEQAEQVQQLSAAEAMRPFDLQRDAMLRSQVLKLDEESYVLLLTMHHIASDGWSLGVLVKEMATLYAAFSQGHPSPLPELAIQYADFAMWQRNYLQGEVLAGQLQWWQEQLASAPALLQLPSDHPRPAHPSYRGGLVRGEIAVPMTEALRQLSRRQGCTLYMTLLAAFQVLLHRYTGQAEIVVGSPIANRNRAEVEPLIGFFVNTLALRCNLAGNPTFLEVLSQVQTTTQAAYDHQDLPFERLVEGLQPERNLAYNPLVQVIFALQNAPLGDFTLLDLQVAPVEAAIHTTRFDLEFHVREVADTLQIYCIYSRDLFEADTIERLVGHYQQLLQGIVADPTQPIAHLPLLTAAERHQLLVEWNTTTDYPKDKTLPQLFEEQVERTPDAVAVVMAENQKLETGDWRLSDSQSPISSLQSLTYQELNQRANQLAHYLQSLGVGPEVLVGICVERSIEMVVGLLAILKAGGAYVPLDPNYPSERWAFILQDAAPSVVITQTCHQNRFTTTTKLVLLDRFLNEITETHHMGHAEKGGRPTALSANLAYVIYTSGSTGQPKGTLLTHRGLVNLAQAQMHTFAVQPGDRILQVASLNFDASIWEIVMALCAGATLVLASSEQLLPGPPLTATFQTQAISHATLVPSVLAQLDPVALPMLRTVIVAGEACSAPLAARWATNRHLFNAYGPTETTVCATIMDCDQWQNRQQPPPIGRPLANLQVYILDPHQQLLPVGVAGQLCVAGAGLARGYHNRPQLTEEKFIANPFGEGRLYQTGDLCCWLPDGQIEYLGRIDQQVKLRGLRIELGEIEAVLRQHPAVQEAAVVLQTEPADDKQLIAYLVAVQEAGLTQGDSCAEWQSHLIAQVRNNLQAKLPSYMIPSAFVLLARLPLTPNGKVDRKALPAPVSVHRRADHTFVAPRTATERAIATIWSATLGIEPISIADSFFELGGHSLLATQVVSRIWQNFAVDLPLRYLFETPTIAGLADYIDTVQLLQSEPAANAMPAGDTTYTEGRL